MRVLSCSPVQELRWMREKILTEAGCEVVSSTNKAEALRSLETQNFDVLLLGHALSQESLDELCSGFRRRSPDGRIVVVLGKERDKYCGDTDEVVHGLDGPDALIHAVMRRA